MRICRIAAWIHHTGGSVLRGKLDAIQTEIQALNINKKQKFLPKEVPT